MRLIAISGFLGCALFGSIAMAWMNPRPHILPSAASRMQATVPLSADEKQATPDSFLAADDPNSAACACKNAKYENRILPPEEFDALLVRYAKDPAQDSRALDTLLFFHKQTAEWLKTRGQGVLDAKRSALLNRELTRTHAWVTLRVVDENNRVRLSTGRRHVPLSKKQHLSAANRDAFPASEFNGTVKRTGLHHIWIRI